ncbi:MAG: signal transduction histidine kinase [Ascidiaceihabitans sp.]|jgi:signal transduction histidine kinase
MNTQSENESSQSLNRRPVVTKDSKDFEDFIYLLSHDVRSSIRALLEVPQWIAEDLVSAGHKIDGQLADNINLMNTHTQRLDRMLIDLLVYSRIGRSQQISTISLQSALDTVLEQVKIPKGFEIDVDFQIATLEFGERDILTLLSSLISNSIKHHHSKTGNIKISSQNEDNVCVLRVSDNGPGIPEKYAQRVFEAMTTLKPRDEIEGSGMGLAIVRKIVDQYEGDLECLSYSNASGTIMEMRFSQGVKLPI